MQQSDFNDFKVVLEATAQMYGKVLTATIVALWWEALKGYDLAAVREGFGRHMQNPDTGQFMPKPADIVRMLGGTTQDGALLAWSKVDRAVRSIGPYETVAFDDPIIHAVITDMGGWVALGSKTEHEWPFVAREFENRYRGYRLGGGVSQYPPALAGIAQTENVQSGLPTSAPVLIGERAQAMQTVRLGSNTPPTPWHRLPTSANNDRQGKPVLALVP